MLKPVILNANPMKVRLPHRVLQRFRFEDPYETKLTAISAMLLNYPFRERLYPGADRSKFAKLGLEAGDLVTHVNGVPLADAQHGMEILKNLGGAQSAEVTIERSGQTQTLTVDTQKIAALNPSDAPGTAAPPAQNSAPPLAAPRGPNH